MKRRAWWYVAALPLLVAMGWAAFAPIELPTRDKLFEIPKGTYARRRAGDLVDIIPPRITLTLGVDDVLLLRNLDDVPQQFGPTILMPGQSFRLPFERESENRFECTAHSSGQMLVIVEARPLWPWQKVRWRWRHWFTRG